MNVMNVSSSSHSNFYQLQDWAIETHLETSECDIHISQSLEKINQRIFTLEKPQIHNNQIVTEIEMEKFSTTKSR